MSISNQNFSRALWDQYRFGKMPVIPDIKIRSPREGDLLRGRDPAEIVEILVAAGTPVVSVVTEPSYFGGSPDLLRRIVQAASLPVLRKDFIQKREQLQESADLGASAVLLIASMLEQEQLFRLVEAALALGLEPLVETHDQAEINFANGLNLTMMGINNRNIVELEMDNGSVSTTEKLAGLIGPGVLVVSESSISSPSDVQRALAAGAHAVLTGTAILQARDPGEMYRSLGAVGVKSL
jgi:indole-3-glycerol phosphate synthase